jgi:hypothetical protein
LSYKPKAHFCSLQGCKKEQFQIDGSEIATFDHFVTERTRAHGTRLDYWHQDLPNTARDKLYDEPVNRAWRGPYKIYGYVEYSPGQPEMREEGIRVTWTGNIWIARKEIENASAPPPLEGDIIRYWPLPFFAEHGVNNEESAVSTAGYFFDVVNSDDDGHIAGAAAFVGFKLEVRRRTEFTPERRLLEDNIYSL